MPGARTFLNLRSARFLVVEDNPQALEILCQVLVGFGISDFRKCETVEEAHRTFAKGVFDVIIVDGEMAVEDGFAFTHKIRSSVSEGNRTAPILIVTGCPTREKVLEARDCGANFVLAKPIVPRTLLDRLIWMARHRRDFIESDTYCGPDRRFHNVPLPEGIEDRRADAVKLTATPTRELSQSEIDSLF